MEYFNIWLNPRQRRLIWPGNEDKIAPPPLHREIIAERRAIGSRAVHTVHQRDACVRDAALEHEDDSQIKTLTARTYAQDLRNSLWKMEQELRGITTPVTMPVTIPRKRRISQESLLTIDIAQISATGFHFNLYRPENKVF